MDCGSMQFYLDPSSDYAFFSKKDALRYLEAGDVTKCVIKPVRRNAEGSVSSPNIYPVASK